MIEYLFYQRLHLLLSKEQNLPLSAGRQRKLNNSHTACTITSSLTLLRKRRRKR